MASALVAGTARGPSAGIGQRAIRAAKDRLSRLWYSTRASFDPNTGRLAPQQLWTTQVPDGFARMHPGRLRVAHLPASPDGSFKLRRTSRQTI
jgi:hypothetical protein